MRQLALLFVLLPCVAFAQVPASGSSSTSQAGSQSGATSTNTIAPQQEMIFANQQPAATTTTVRNAPPIYAPNISPTTPCTSVITGGASFIGWGVSLGGTYEDKECTRREFARSLQIIGQHDAALAVLCSNAEVDRAAPQLCARVRYVMGKPVDYVGSEPPVMPPAPVSLKPAPPPPTTPQNGTIGYGTDGKKYQYDGANWNAIEPAVTAPANVPAPVMGAPITPGPKPR